MRTDDPEPGGSSSPGDESDSRAGIGPARRRGWTIAAGVLAGLVAWLGGEACRDAFRAPRRAERSRGTIMLMVVHPRDQDRADARNAALAFAILGAAVGAGLGTAGGLLRRSGRAAATAAGIGLIAGAIACAALALAILPLYDAYKRRDPDAASRDLVAPLLILGGIWSAAGAAGGLAHGIGLGARRNLATIALAGLAGAAVGASVYELIAATTLPMAVTTRFVATTWPSRLFARLAVAVLAAVGVAWAAAEGQRSAPRREDGNHR